MKKLIVIAGLVLTGACTADKPLPEGSDKFPTPESTTQTTTTSNASSCDVVREALLTGTQEDINAAMQALVADKSADATAREYAEMYLSDGARGATEAQETGVMVIRTYCSL